MKLTFCGAARTVTGSCYLAEHEGHKFLIDCGMFQGNKVLKDRNYGEFPFVPSDIEFVLLTHSHIDHSGLLPKLYLQGFKGSIYATTVTRALCEIMLPDSGYIQESEVERKNRKLARAGKPLITPIYTAADALETYQLIKGVEYAEEFSPLPGLRVVLQDAGHIFGSAMIELYYTEDGQQRKMVFTGDLGRNDQAIVRDPHVEKQADFLVIESTYGDRLHQGMAEDEVPHFASIINDTFRRGGNVIIPAFAVDRTQDILFIINEMQNKNMIVNCKVYVDSPMAIAATEIFAAFPHYYDRMSTKLFQEEGRPPFKLDNLIYTKTMQESQQLNAVRSGAIIISASGMADAGRIKHHLKHNLWRKESSVLFFGYQAEGTLGRRLISGEPKVTIHGEEIEVKAQIYNMEGFSAHADKNELLTWLRGFDALPSRIFVTHGEEASALSFAETLKSELHAQAEAPEYGACVDLTLEAPAQIVLPAADFFTRISSENLLVDINTLLQQITLQQDAEKLIRVRDYLRSVS